MVVAVDILFSVCAALFFGAGHYMSGTVSRRVGPLTVACWTQFGVVAVAAALLLTPAGGTGASGWSLPALLWGTAAAVGGVAGSLALYAALSRATFTLAVGASTVTTTVTPAVVAMTLLGEEMTALRLALVGLAVLTVWLLVSQHRSRGVAVVTSPLPTVTPQSQAPGEETSRSRPGAGRLALGAGLGYAAELVSISQIPGESFAQGLGAWAAVSFIILVALMLLHGARKVLPRGIPGALVILAGGFSATGMLLFHLSAASIGLATTSAIVAIYPAVPILLAVMILHERPSRRGWAGLACAAVVVGLGALSTGIQG